MTEQQFTESNSSPLLPVTFSDLANKIVRASIRSAICIDDIFVEPYMDETRINDVQLATGRTLKKDVPMALYNSFRQEGKCDLDIYHFKSFEESWKPDYMLNNKDLIVIDWELDGPNGGSISTLRILDEIISINQYSNPPFIIIYTSKPEADFKIITKELISNFHPFGSAKTQMLELFANNFTIAFNECFEQVIENDDVIIWVESLSDDLYDYWNKTDSQRRTEITTKICQSLNSQFKVLTAKQSKTEKKLTNALEATFNKVFSKGIESLFYVVNDSVNGKEYYLDRIGSKGIGLKINDSIITIFSKDEGAGEGVKPNEVFGTFSDLVCQDPHNFMTLLSLEMKEKLRDDAAQIGNNISSMDEKAFFYHMNYYKTRSHNYKNEFFDFLLDCWINEIENYNYNNPPKVFEMLENYSKEKGYDNIDRNLIRKELGELNLKLSTIRVKDRLERNSTILFGDIFNIRRCSGRTMDFFICITPMCVCVDPEKVNNNFYFIRSKDFKPYVGSSAEEKIESGFYSLIPFDNTVYAIEWDTKPFTLFIPDNNLKTLESNYCSEQIFLDYITTVKENFAQRISNQSFSYGTAVGIDLPHLFKVK